MGVWTPGPGPTTGDDTFDGDNTNETASGGDGADTLNGAGGNDTLNGDDGADILNGGLGVDTVNGGAGDDTILYAIGDGNGVINGGDGTDTLSVTDGAAGGILNATWSGSALTVLSGNSLSNIETITADLGGGVDWLVYGAGSAAVTVNLATGSASGFTSISNIERVVGGGANDTLTGDALDNRLDGGAGDDVLVGGGGIDTLIGGDGADAISGGLANDSIQGGAGDDTISWAVGDGRDTIDGGADADTFNATGSAGVELGNANWNGTSLTALMDNGLANIEAINLDLGGGTDWLIYNAAAAVIVDLSAGAASGFASVANIEKVIGGSGNDTLTGDGLDNRLDGQAGNDTLNGGAGVDAVLGGDGDDIIYASAGNDSLQGQNGNDTFHWTSADGRDTFNGGADTDTVNLTGSAAADVADANWNGSAITGLLNNALVDIETINLDLGAGGPGGDWLRYNTAFGVTVDLAAGTGTGFASITGVENLIGGTGNDTLTGDAGANKINGNTGDDLITGGLGGDTLTGLAGNDTFVWNWGDGGDVIDGGADTDTINFIGNAGTNFFSAQYNGTLVTSAAGVSFSNVEALNADMGGGEDWLSYTTTAAVIVSLAGGTASGFASIAGFENVIGGAGNDNITGDAAANKLQGGAGDDFLEGGAGNDALTGGDGVDTLSDTGDGANIDAGDGDDHVYVHGTGGILVGGAGNDDLTVYSSLTPFTVSGFETLQTSGGNLAGTADQFESFDTICWALGGSFNFTVTLTLAAAGTIDLTDELLNRGVLFFGSSGDDSITSSNGADTLNGNNGGDVLVSGAGNDTLNGGAGADTLDGGTGADAMSGGDGDDLYFVDNVGDGVTESSNQGTDTVQSSVTFTLGANVENLTLTGVGDINGTGNTLDNIISGNSGANVIEGGAGDDTLTGGDGADTLSDTGDGADIDAGDGDDHVFVHGTGGTLVGGAGNDDLTVYSALTPFTVSGFETLQTSGGNLAGTADQFESFDTICWALGGSFNFTVTLTLAATGTVDLTDELLNRGVVFHGSSGDDTITSSNGADTLNGNGGADTLSAGDGNDTISGGNGNDIIEGGAGNDNLDGGADTDTLSYANATSGITVSFALFGSAQNTGGAGTDTINNFENLTGSAFDDTLFGNGNANIIDGGAGVDTMSYAGVGNYVTVSLALQGSAQSTFAGGSDTLLNFENLTGTSFNDTLEGDANDNVIAGGSGTDMLSYSAATTGVTVSLALQGGSQNTVAAGLDTLSGFENLTGSAFNDSLTGDNNSNTIVGGSGDDTLIGAYGADLLYGGDGDDALRMNDDSALLAGEVYDGGAGTDTLVASLSINDVRNATVSSIERAQFVGAVATQVIYLRTEAIGTGFSTTLAIDGGNITSAAMYIYRTSAGTTDVSGWTFTNWSAASYVGFSGSSGADVLIGSSVNDLMVAEAGNDTLTGGAGIDNVSGGAGNDTLQVITGGHGASGESYDGGADTDTLLLGEGNDFRGASFASIEQITFNGTANTTWFDAEDFGGSGFADNLAVTSLGGSQIIELYRAGAGTTDVTGWTFSGSVQVWLRGSAGADIFYGTTQGDVMLGGAGNDVLEGGAGNDTLNGEGDTDTASYANAGSAVTVDLSTAAAQNTGGAGSDTLSNIENLTGSSHNDTLTGDASANVLSGGDGDDALTGGAGVDTVAGGGGNDTLRVITGGHGLSGESYDGGADTDTLLLGEGNDFRGAVFTSIEQITFNGTANTTWFDAEDFGGGGFADNLAVTSLGGSQIIELYRASAGTTDVSEWTFSGTVQVWLRGSTGADTFYGTTQGDMILGGDGNDTLEGGAGNDTITGDAGNDTIEGGAGNDNLDGGADTDTLSYANATSGITVSFALFGSAQNTGGAGIDTISNFEHLIGSSFSDTLFGNGNAGTIDGGGGTDTMSYAGVGNYVTVSLALQGSAQDTFAGGLDTLLNFENLTGTSFNDTLEGDANNNVIDAGSGTDLLSYANAGAGVTVSLTLQGGSQDTIGAGLDTLSGFENLTGSAFNDSLTGDSGANTINGGGGDDTLAGAGGSDTFVYAAGAGADTIADFDADAFGGQDFISLTGFGITSGDFGSRVTITDLGSDTLITIDGSVTITLTGVSGDGANVITQSDFILGP